MLYSCDDISVKISYADGRWLQASPERLAKQFLCCIVHCVSKNDKDVLRYNFNAHQPISIIFGRDIAEWICY